MCAPLARFWGAFGSRPLNHRDERCTARIRTTHLGREADAHRVDAFGRLETKVKAETVHSRHFCFGGGDAFFVQSNIDQRRRVVAVHVLQDTQGRLGQRIR